MIISFVDIGGNVGHHFLFIMKIYLYSITTEFYFAITSSIFHESLISCTLPINYKKYCHIYLELINFIISRLNLYLRSHHDSMKWGDIHVLSLNIKKCQFSIFIHHSTYISSSSCRVLYSIGYNTKYL